MDTKTTRMKLIFRKQIILFCMVFGCHCSSAQVKNPLFCGQYIEILNEEITMRKHCQDAIELSLRVCPNRSMTKNMEFSRYVESNGIACAYFDLPLLNIKEIPVLGLEYFLEDSNNEIVYCKGLVLSAELVHPEKPQTKMVVPVVKKNLRIKKTKIKKQDYSDYLKSNQITIHDDTIVNVYPLINWVHRGIEKGEYHLFLIYKDRTNDSTYVGPIISNKVKLIVK